MKSRAGPSGCGGVGRKCKNMFKPNTTKMSPSKLRAMMVAVFISILLFIVLCCVKNSKLCRFQNDLAARMAAFTQFMSTPGFRQGKDSFNDGLYLAGVDQPCDFSEIG